MEDFVICFYDMIDKFASGCNIFSYPILDLILDPIMI